MINTKVEGLEVPSGQNNVVYHVTECFIKKYGFSNIDVNIRLIKGVPPASGLGSSGASSAAIAYALVQLLYREISEFELLRLAAEGEAIVAGAPHYDNVAASLFGGIVLLDLIKGRVYRIKLHKPMYIAIILPKNIIRTSERKTGLARSILPKSIDLDTYVKQSSLVAKLIYALSIEDLELFGEAVSIDFVAEPYRSKLIPYYNELKELAVKLGALGFNISGAGPAVFSIYRSYNDAVDVGKKLISYLNDRGLYSDLIVSRVSEKGVEMLG